ncbi:MAG: hypothetical protein NXI20_03620 [bacterium]|nr:hypothetical protein [bacterium]
MFTEYEIDTMVENQVILNAASELKKDFIKNEAPYLEISDHDFFSLVMMAPTVGIALANGSVSLFEELALNKKARKLSKGGYFMKKDPVVYAMKYLIKTYDTWEDKFFNVIKLAMEELFNKKSLEGHFDSNTQFDYEQYKVQVLKMPYIFIRFLSSFFLEDDENIISYRSINKVDYGRLVEIGKKLGFDKVPLFHLFIQTFKVK